MKFKQVLDEAQKNSSRISSVSSSEIVEPAIFKTTGDDSDPELLASKKKIKKTKIKK